MMLFIRPPNRARGAKMRKAQLVAAALTCLVVGAIVDAMAGDLIVFISFCLLYCYMLA